MPGGPHCPRRDGRRRDRRAPHHFPAVRRASRGLNPSSRGGR
ncbi:hypothetical protein HMPREF1550_00043 [Actinomyces sp. oral taxon 877 str. F0543]|nr:hypothetical protein HMPREF1550_00043 [Actinomyces sp. oral taxon 877 str. F0543]